MNNFKKDVGGFYITIRGQNSETLVEHHAMYDSRIDQIDGSSICDGSGCRNLELCVLSKSSRGTISGWFDSQCVYLPSDFESIRRRYSARSEQVFYVHSIVKKIQARRALTAEDLASSQRKIHFSGFLMTVMVTFSLAF